MGPLLADIPLRLLPADMVLITAPIANLMILAEMFTYWRFGRRPALRGSRMTIALGAGCPALIAANVAIFAWHPAALFIIAAMLVAWVAHSYGRTTSPISKRSRMLLIGLRILIVLLLLAYLLKPTLRRVEVFYEKAILVLMFDTSKSMNISDAGADARTSRADALRSALAAESGRLDKLSELFDVRKFTFDERCNPDVKQVSDALKMPAGETTALGRSIRDAVQISQGRKISGVIVFTDGVDNAVPAGEPMRVAEDLGRLASPVPIWTVGLGRETPATNRPAAIIKELALSDRRIPAFNVLGVHAVYDLINLPAHPVKVELVFGQGDDAKVVDTKTIQAANGKTADTVSLDMQVTPTTAGFHAVTVRVADDAKAPDGKALGNEFSRRTDYVQV
ncbi:MAG: VWA domain-containing protein, partial [Phycisphaerae bacterium]|nr:VWA domain-containing protein [Phycisphaerae bacterium]